MDEGKQRGGALAAILAVGALGIAAVPAYGALSGDDPAGAGATQQSAPGFVQGEGRGDERPEPRDENCPKDGRGGGGGGDRGQDGGSAPEGGGSQEGVSSDSAALY